MIPTCVGLFFSLFISIYIPNLLEEHNYSFCRYLSSKSDFLSTNSCKYDNKISISFSISSNLAKIASKELP